jgi:hypothetical protein
MADKCRSEYPKIIAHCRRVNVKKLNTGRLKNPPEELAGSELRVGCGRGILSRRVQIRYNPITRTKTPCVSKGLGQTALEFGAESSSFPLLEIRNAGTSRGLGRCQYHQA